VVSGGRNRILALDTMTGRERWRAEVTQVTHYEPALDDATVLVSADDRVVALERASGERRWEATVGDHAGGVALTRAGSDVLALVTTERGILAGLDNRPGRARWSVQVPGAIWAAPARSASVGAGRVLWTDGGQHLRVFDLATGAVRWEVTVAPGASAPLIRDGEVVIGEGDGNCGARVVGRDLASGTERWSVPGPASFEAGVPPGAGGDDVAVCAHFGTNTLVDGRRGATRWQTALRAPILDTRVVLTPHAVVLRTYGGETVVLRRREGPAVPGLHPGGVPVRGWRGPRPPVLSVRACRAHRARRPPTTG